MNPTLVSQVVLAPWRQRDRSGSWGRVAFYTVIALALGALFVFLPGAQVLVYGALALAVLVLWCLLASSLMEQNHPHAARLVPGHVRRLRQVTVAAWLASCSVMALLVWLAVAPLATWASVLLPCAAACVFVVWMQRQPMLWMAPVLVALLDWLLPVKVQEASLWPALADAWSVYAAWALVPGLLALGLLLARAFSGGDSAHRARYARDIALRRLMRDGMDPAAGWQARGRGGQDPLTRAWLGRHLARARPDTHSAMARAALVLLGPNHAVRQAPIFGALLVIVALAMALLAEFAPGDVNARPAWSAGGLGMAFVVGLAAGGFPAAFAAHAALWGTRREQALLVLLPGMPQGGALNRALAGMLLRHFLAIWALLGAFTMVVGHASNDPYVACLPWAALPIGVASVLRAAATLRAPRAVTPILQGLGVVLSSLPLVLLSQWLGLPPWALAGASVALSAAWFAWRWRALTHEPPALPVGRLR